MSTSFINIFVAYFDTIDDETGEIIERKEMGRRTMEYEAKNIISSYYYQNKWDEKTTKYDDKEIVITQKIESTPNITYKYHVVNEGAL